MSDVLCIYYSRTGNTQQQVQEVAAELGAEVVEVRDSVDRTGWKGFFRCGLDAMRRTTHPLQPFTTQRKLGDYRLVIVASPVWAGRCSSVIRGFLKEHGGEIRHAAYLLSRGGEDKNEEIYDQMDLYTPCGHVAAASLRAHSVGCAFWREEFLRQVREFLDQQ